MEEINASSLEQPIETQYIISVEKFIFLSVITFGLYSVWWNYKAWRFFQQKENSNLNPALRTIFGIFFIIPLFDKIIKLAKEKGYHKNYSSTLLFIGYLFLILLSYLPDPFWLVSIFAFLFFINPFKALNFAKLNSTGYEVIEQKSFNGRQIFLIVIGSIWWILVLFSFYIFFFGDGYVSY